jgi:hypothetical protein
VAQVLAGAVEKMGNLFALTMRHTALSCCLFSLTALLGGCDMLGIETAPQVAEKKEAEGRAIGSACRHAIRSIEDCFGSNPKAGKAAVFAGWKDMDTYMRENQIVGMPNAPKAPDAAATEAEPEAAEPEAAHGKKAVKS